MVTMQICQGLILKVRVESDWMRIVWYFLPIATSRVGIRLLLHRMVRVNAMECTFANNTVGLKFNTSMAYGTAPNYVNNTFTDNGTAVCIDSLPGNEVIDFAGSVFSGNNTDIENKADHAVDTAKATFE